MNIVLPSTLVLTLLLSVGLFFFVRASVKDRTQTQVWELNQPETDVVAQVTQYLEERAYQLKRVDRDRQQVLFEGMVGASLGLAIFLSVLVALGLLCLGLVVAIQVPQVGDRWLGAVMLAPIAGWFYYQNAQRPEQVTLRAQGLAADAPRTKLVVTAHREELRSLQAALAFPEPVAVGDGAPQDASQ